MAKVLENIEKAFFFIFLLRSYFEDFNFFKLWIRSSFFSSILCIFTSSSWRTFEAKVKNVP